MPNGFLPIRAPRAAAYDALNLHSTVSFRFISNEIPSFQVLPYLRNAEAWVFKVSHRDLYAVVVWRITQDSQLQLVG